MSELKTEYRITSTAQLREVIPEPPELLKMKVFNELIDDAVEFVAESPLILLCTADAEGNMDVSPKGDAPGFVEVTDGRTLTIPDRPGNRLAFGFNNLLENPHISVIFVRPGVRETLRVNGKAALTRDPDVLQRFAVKGKPAQLCTQVAVEECFFHCGKALIRSKLWQPDTWAEGRQISFGKQFTARTGGDEAMAEKIDANVAEDYENNLY